MAPSEVSAVYPAGKYYIGDLCYALKDDVYKSCWGKHDYQPGTFTVDANINGQTCKFSVNHTTWGDGFYRDSVSGNFYAVDAGVIGIVPLELCDPNNMKDGKIKGGHFIESTSNVQFEACQGIFVIAYNMTNTHTEMIIIDTSNTDSDDDDDDESVGECEECQCDECLEHRPQ